MSNFNASKQALDGSLNKFGKITFDENEMEEEIDEQKSHLFHLLNARIVEALIFSHQIRCQ